MKAGTAHKDSVKSGNGIFERAPVGRPTLIQKFHRSALGGVHDQTGGVQLNAGTVNEDSVKGGNDRNCSMQMAHAARNDLPRKFRNNFLDCICGEARQERLLMQTCQQINARYVLSRIRVGHRELGVDCHLTEARQEEYDS